MAKRKITGYQKHMGVCLRKHKMKGKSKIARISIFKSCAKSWSKK